MTHRRWNVLALSALSTLTILGSTLPAYAQEDPLDAIRAAANDPGKGDTGKGTTDTGKGKGKPGPETPQPPSVPSTGPETWLAVALVVGAGAITLRMAGKTIRG